MSSSDLDHVRSHADHLRAGSLVAAVGRPEHRMWNVVIGLVEVVVGIIIVAIPGIGVGTLAFLVAIAFILRGIGTLTVGWALRRAR